MKNKTNLIWIIVFSMIILSACNQNKLAVVTIMGDSEIIEVTGSKAIIKGEILEVGEDLQEYGHVWSETDNPTTSNFKSVHTNVNDGFFYDTLKNLLPSKKYYLKAYSIDGDVVTYEDLKFFNTGVSLPEVTTKDITNINFPTASCGGDVLNSGGETLLIARGVCWNTTGNPTIEDSKTVDGTETGGFSSNIAGLTELTTYYVRAYAINSAGVAYGEEKSFSSAITTDYDGNEYEIIQIGTQIWMKENIKTTTYSNGDPITLVTETEDWMYLTFDSKAYCYYNNNANNEADTYGALYTWPAAMNGSETEGTQGVCPYGWHIPSDSDWNILTDYLGGSDVAGGKLKEAGTIHWIDPNTGADNSSGFTSLPGGWRYNNNGLFEKIGEWCYFWSSSYDWEDEGTTGNGIRIGYNLSSTYIDGSDRDVGRSVRCVKD